MSRFSDYIKQRKESNLDFFFGTGNWRKCSNKYFTFKRIIDEDNIIIVTNNIKLVKGSLVLVVANNKAVFLKDWQILSIKNWDLQLNSYVVKLNKNFFKVYEFKTDFENIYIDQETTFDELVKISKEQEDKNIKWALGHY